jgi:hypothetical protein
LSRVEFSFFFFRNKTKKKQKTKQKKKNETKYFAAATDGYNIFKSAGDSFLYIYIERWALHFVAFVFFSFFLLDLGSLGSPDRGRSQPAGPANWMALDPPSLFFPKTGPLGQRRDECYARALVVITL